MLSNLFSRSAGIFLGWVCILSIGVAIPAAIAADDCNIYGCPDDCEFTTDFRLEDCKFQNKGSNPYFILRPGYRLVLETPQGAEEREKSVETVLADTKWINLDGRMIKTRVLEERAFEWDDEENDWVNVEISLNWFAICNKTNAVYYFGEWSRDCPDGFDENDECEDESNEGSWEAGIDGARPGLMMAGTPLLGAKYFQEIAPPDAVDRGEIVAMGLDIDVPAGDWSGCINILDTNPAEGACGDEDSKIFCPGVGLVRDQELELVEYGIDYEYLIKRFVSRFYRLCLNRDPDEKGLDGWTKGLMKKTLNAEDIAKGFIFSREFIERNTSDEDFLSVLYKAFFDRDADILGWNGWLNTLKGGKGRDEVLDGFLNSQEFIDLAGEYGINPK